MGVEEGHTVNKYHGRRREPCRCLHPSPCPRHPTTSIMGVEEGHTVSHVIVYIQVLVHVILQQVSWA